MHSGIGFLLSAAENLRMWVALHSWRRVNSCGGRHWGDGTVGCIGGGALHEVLFRVRVRLNMGLALGHIFETSAHLKAMDRGRGRCRDRGRGR